MANQVNSSTFKRISHRRKESVDTAGCYRSSCVVNGLVKLFYVRCNQCGISDTAGNRTDRINYGRVKQQSTKANKRRNF